MNLFLKQVIMILCNIFAVRHNTKRLVDARIVTWNGPRWTTFSVTEAVRRIIMSDRRIGGFEVIVRDSEENIIDANAVIDPTECTSMNSKCLIDIYMYYIQHYVLVSIM